MPNPRLAQRYAKSLTDIAVETNSLEEVYDDLKVLKNTCSASSEFVTFLKSPIINQLKKEKIFSAIFKKSLAQLTNKFVILLIKKGREGFLPEIVEAAIDQYREIKNIRKVKMTTAVALSDTLTTEIKQKIKEEIPGQTIELATLVKADLIGGFVLESNNNIYDASISRKLHDIRNQFLENNAHVQN